MISLTRTKGPSVTKISHRQKQTSSLAIVQNLSFFWIIRCLMRQLHEFKKFLMSIGDSIVLVADEEIVKGACSYQSPWSGI